MGNPIRYCPNCGIKHLWGDRKCPPKKAQEVKAKYGITTKWDGITTYHETTEPIGKVKEK